MNAIDQTVQAIIVGAAALHQPATAAPIKTAYAAVIHLLRTRYPHLDLTRIEEKPDSARGRVFLTEDLTAANAGADDALLVAVHALIDALDQHDAQAAAAVGVDIRQVKAAALRLRAIRSSGVGAHVEASEFSGDIEMSDVRAGGEPTAGHRAEISDTSVGGDLHVGDKVYVTDPNAPDSKVLRENYLRRVLAQLDALALSGIDPKSAGGEAESRLRLSAVYTGLLTKRVEQDDRAALDLEVEDRIGEHAKTRVLSAIEQLNTHKNLVLLGDPGGGKSSFVNFVALCMAGALLDHPTINLNLLTAPLPPEAEERDPKKAEAPESQPWDHGALLPVRVILRDFAASGLPAAGEIATAQHLWQFIAVGLHSAGLGDYAELLRQHLLKQGGLILLDGLDEVPEAEQRRAQIKQAVEDFAATYGQCRFLVTSRTYAYQNQAWKLRNFESAVLAPFTDGQIRHFVDRWYAHRATVLLQDAGDAQGRAERLKNAIMRNTRLHALAERPLLLTLMASLHAWRGGNLPERREELYADAVDLLLEWWEGQRVVRNAKGEVLFMQRSLAEYLNVGRQKVLALLSQLAYQAHASQPTLTGTADIAESELVNGLLAISDRADLQPRLLVDYLSQRAGLLTPRGVKIYTFPHRTFQEYLAACYLTEDHFPDKLAGLARTDPRWREVTLLAAAKVARGTPFALWSLVDELCHRTPDAADYGAADDWGALLAGQAIDETTDLTHLSDRNRARVDRVRYGLVHGLEKSALAAVDRALAGRILAHLGDPRSALMSVTQMPFCWIPAGPFYRTTDETTNDEAPKRRKQKSTSPLAYDYWMSRYPVSNAQFQRFMAAGGYTEPRFWAEAQKEQYWSERGFKGLWDNEVRTAPYDYGEPFNLPNHPIVGISWYEAVAFCRWLSTQLTTSNWVVRLPSEIEWEKAARGGVEMPVTPEQMTFAAQTWTPAARPALQRNEQPQRSYPWGDQADAERANCSEADINSTSALGCFGNGASPYSIEELSGNVWEWTNDVDERGYPWLRGGSYGNDADGVGSSARFWYGPFNRYNVIGFRCVVVPISR